jgi:hypothetical protein
LAFGAHHYDPERCLAYANSCQKQDGRIPDIFLARGSDGHWYYEMILKINPIILGTGTPLFRSEERPVNLELTDARTFVGGVAIHRYRIAR